MEFGDLMKSAIEAQQKEREFKAKPTVEKLLDLKRQATECRDKDNERIAILEEMVRLLEQNPDAAAYAALLDALV